ncbi:hypothetical protein BKA69DRAFT_608889 [Paraphysoderma sedebokerense]|nr:hypothetical protein BKA69DRAFT_608889 [Paraphysoderma sedebokerense]
MITTTAPSLSSQTDNNSPLYSLFVKSTVEEKDYTLKISDEELFKICEGRTARKGARYDQGGKLERVDEKCVQNVDVENIQKEGSENLEGKVMNASGGDFAPLEKDCVGKKKGSSKKRKAVGEEEKRDKTKRVKKSKFDEKEATKEKQRRKKSKSKGAFDVPSVADGQIEEPEAPEKKKRKGETSDDKASRKKKKKEKRKEK